MEADGIQYDGAKGLYDELQEGISKVTIAKLMSGSCIFGESIGETLCNKFIENFPNWKIMTPSYSEILTKKDFGPARAILFSTRLDKFKEWLYDHPELSGITIQKVIKNNCLQDYVFTFTGFTDKIATSTIESYGGKVLEKFRSDVTIVVAKDITKETDKTKAAKNSNGKTTLISQYDFDNWLSKVRVSCGN